MRTVGRHIVASVVAVALCLVPSVTRLSAQESKLDSRVQLSQAYVQVEVAEVDTNMDGVVDLSLTWTNTYDQQGKPRTARSDSDINLDGTPDLYTGARTYDQQGNVLAEVEEVDYDADGTVNVRVTITNTYDAHRNLLTQAVDNAFLSRQPDRDSISRVIEGDIGADGTVDEVTTVTNTFNLHRGGR